MPRRDPIRLSALTSQSSGELRRAVREMRAQGVSDGMVESLQQRLAAQLGPEALVAAGTPLLKSSWLCALFSVGVTAFSFVAPPLAVERMAVPHAPHRAAALASIATAPPLAASISSPPSQQPAAQEPEPPAPVPKRRTRVLQPSHRPPETELALLRSAHAQLRSNPQSSLALTERHARLFAHGVFAQEREILAIEALLKQHERGLALARAQRFLDRYAASPYTFRIQLLIEQAPQQSLAPLLAESKPSDQARPR